MQETGEERHLDFKLGFDTSDDRAKIDLLKNLVAMANSGGGIITIGRDETLEMGIDHKTRRLLDSARLQDVLDRYCHFTDVHISHSIDEIDNDRCVLNIQISKAEYPIVMSRKGDWKGMNNRKQKPLFLEGDIWIRHGTKTERVTFEDMRTWIETAKSQERDRIASRLTRIVNLPEGAEVQIVTSSSDPIDSPQRVLEFATMLHDVDSNHLLSGSQLIWLFLNRSELDELNLNQRQLLLSSALRRRATLYWWIIGIDKEPRAVMDVVRTCLAASDRDKSDAARSIIEVSAIFADDDELQIVLEALHASRYKHFAEAANKWVDRDYELSQIRGRIQDVYNEVKRQADSTNKLEQLATDLAVRYSEKPSSSISRRLTDVNRVLWYRHSDFAVRVLGNSI